MAIELTTAVTGQISGIKASLFLDNVENTSDLDKPVSTAQQAYITGVSGVLQTTIDGLDASNHVTYNTATGDVNLGVHKIVATTGEFTNLNISSNIVVGGTVDGRDIAALGSVIDGLGTISTFNSGDFVDVYNAQEVGGIKTFNTGIKINSTYNQITLGTGDAGNKLIVTAPLNINGNRTYTIPDVGSSAAFVLNQGPQTINGIKTLTSDLRANANATVSGNLGVTGNLTLNNEPTQDKHAATKKYVDDHAVVAATTTTTGHVELATDAEAHAATDTTRAVTPSNLLIKKDGGGAIIAGDFNGDSRGGGALDVQSYRNSSSQVASGASSSAVGYDNRAFGTSSSAFGYNNNAAAFKSSTFGYSNEALGDQSSAVGYNNTSLGFYSSAFGYYNTAGGSGSSMVGNSNVGSGLSCVGFGNNNVASASSSSAVGQSNVASSSFSCAVGYGNGASGTSCSAFGYANITSGSGSSVFGTTNASQGDYSSLFGNNNREIGTANWFSNSLFGYNNEVTSGGSGSGPSIQNLTVVGYKNSWTQYTSILAATAVGYQNKPKGSYSSLVGASNEEAGPTSASFTKNSIFGYDNVITAGIGSGLSIENCTIVGYQNSWTQNTSLSNATAVGHSNTASGNYGSSALGYGNQALGDRSTAVGNENEASNGSANAFGRGNIASGSYSSAFGYSNTAGGSGASVVGHRVKTTVNNTFEAGYWSGATTRDGAIRIHQNGQVAMTIEDSASAPTDGGATAGSEADGTLPRGMVAFRKNGADLYVDSNTSGTVSTLGLGILQSARVYSPRFIQGFVTGSGAARLSGQASSHTCSLQTGATTGSTAGASIGGNVSLINGAALDGDNANVINFSRKQSCLFKFATNASASCTGWIFWGGPFNNVWTGGPTGKSIGLKLDGNALKLVAHDGSSATTGSSILTMTANITYEILIVADGSGNLEAFRNGTSLGTITGAPTGSTAAPVYPSAQAVIENNATTTNANLQVLGIDIVAGELQ